MDPILADLMVRDHLLELKHASRLSAPRTSVNWLRVDGRQREAAETRHAEGELASTVQRLIARFTGTRKALGW